MLEQLRASSSDEFGLAGQLVSLFLAEAPLKVEGIERAVEENDAEQAAEIAQELSGMCSLIGAGGMGEQCAALRGMKVEPAAARTSAVALRREYGRVVAALEDLMPVKVTR